MRGAPIRRRVFAGAAALALLPLLAAGAPAAPTPRIEQRAPTARERDSFDEFFRARNAAQPRRPWGAAPLFAPAFEIERQRGKPWSVIARVDSAPRRSAPDLCRQIRSSFVYDAAKPSDERWTDAAEAPQWYVWLAQPNIPCQAARYTVLMDQAVPSADAVALLRPVSYTHLTLPTKRIV